MSKSFINEFERAAKLGAAKAMEKHKNLGRPIYQMKNNKVTEVPPEEIEVPQWYLDEQNKKTK